MKLTPDEHIANAEDFINASGGLDCREIDRQQLAEQMRYTDADDEDVEAIANLIEESDG
ncbi:MAG: hypothetical protein ABIH23_08415 [bacterium]